MLVKIRTPFVYEGEKLKTGDIADVEGKNLQKLLDNRFVFPVSAEEAAQVQTKEEKPARASKTKS